MSNTTKKTKARTVKPKENGKRHVLPEPADRTNAILLQIHVDADETPFFEGFVTKKQLNKLFRFMEQKLDPAHELAKNIAAAVSNPALPTLLANAIGQGLTDIENESEVFGDSATEDIKRWLPLAIESLKKKEATA